MRPRCIYLIPILIILLAFLPALHVQAQAMPVVHAVLFYSPSCGHCHLVITETLPPLFEKYGEQFQIAGVDVTNPEGQTLFLSALQKFGQESNGVPFLVIGDIYLVGSLDIPERLPNLIEQYLALGGVDWPDIPGLRATLSQAVDANASVPTETTADGQPQANVHPATPEPAPTSQVSTLPTEIPNQLLTGDQHSSWSENYLHDPAGNTLSVIVLLGMIGSLFWTGKLFRSRSITSLKGRRNFAIPALCLMGFFVAGYLAYVETNQVTAVCGPVGDCNTVQQSEYARLFGLLPIGVLGLLGYTAIIIAWLVARYASGHQAHRAAIILFLMTVFGTLFSIYLTFLEPFVIGATCVWCLTSAVLMTVLMLLTLTPAKAAFSRITGD